MSYNITSINSDINYFYTVDKGDVEHFTCHRCGKDFESRKREHKYMLNKAIFCSYTCRARFVKENPPAIHFTDYNSKGAYKYGDV